MALFRRNGPVVFERGSYGGRRRRRPVPRWLWQLVAGVAIGAGGLYYVQENHLPERLGAQESQQLRERAAALERERQRLQASLGQAEGDAKSARAESERLGGELAAARQSVERLQKDIALFDDMLPPDPRGGAIGVRGARFSSEGSQLAYHVLLTRERAGGRPFKGTMELVVAGDRGGRSDTITLSPLEVAISGYQHLKGRLPLPEGFAARQVTVRVLDRPGGELQGTRVLNVR